MKLKINDNHEIFKVPDKKKTLTRQPFILALRCKNAWNAWNLWSLTENLTMNDIWRHIFWNQFEFFNHRCHYID